MNQKLFQVRFPQPKFYADFDINFFFKIFIITGEKFGISFSNYCKIREKSTLYDKMGNARS